MRIAVYPGSFDPVTYGHIDILKRAQKLFDKVIVAVSENSNKKMFFSPEERIDILKETVAALNIRNIEIRSTKSLTVNFAKENNAICIIRGIRTLSDFDYEFQMALANKLLNKDIETIFLMTDEKYTVVTSSLVKEIFKYGGNLEYFVPQNVIKALHKKMIKEE